MTTELPTPVAPLPTAELTAVLDSWNGALLSRSRVVDDLLDLRNLVAGHAAAVARVDRALAELPGQNLVAREWAVEALSAVVELLGTDR